MKKQFVDWTISKIEASRDISSLEYKRLKYGLEGFYNLSTKLIVIIIIAIIFGLVKELFLLILIYSTLRLYGFGIHAKTSIQCWLSTVPIYIGGCFFIRYATLSEPVVLVIWVLGILSFLFFAPADTAARPLIHKDKRIRAKILSLLIIASYFILNYFIHNKLLLNTTLYALLMQSFAMNPIVYKLFHAPFNNYKTYAKKMV